MSVPFKHLPQCIMLCATLLFAGNASALTCTVVSADSTSSSTTPTTTIAVASNFYTPAQELVQGFLSATSSSSTIRVCHDSSGTLMTEITGTPSYPYTLFLSADEDRPETLQNTYSNLVATDATAFRYANGIPVFYVASGTASDLLLSGQSGSYAASEDQSAVQIDTDSVTRLGIANTSSAPYGAKAKEILTAMGQWSDASVYDADSVYTPSTSGSCTQSAGSTQWICQYKNVAITLSAATAADVNAIFVSWGQVCTSTSTQYVKFPDYAIPQYGILLALSGSTTAGQTLAADLVSYMNLGSTGWNEWLGTRCYGSI